jgi:hypothetical protein
VAHDVITTGIDRQQLAHMSSKAKDAMGVERLEILADRGYFSGEEILACEQIGVTPYVPKPLTSGAKAEGRFGKQDFAYMPEEDAYRCPGGSLLRRHMTTRTARLAPATDRCTAPAASFYTASVSCGPTAPAALALNLDCPKFILSGG